jgi:hypothetical protein
MAVWKKNLTSLRVDDFFMTLMLIPTSITVKVLSKVLENSQKQCIISEYIRER